LSNVEFVPQELFLALVSEVSGKNNSTSLCAGMVANEAEKAFKKNNKTMATVVFGRIRQALQYWYLYPADKVWN
jgi:hypothetical protein